MQILGGRFPRCFPSLRASSAKLPQFCFLNSENSIFGLNNSAVWYLRGYAYAFRIMDSIFRMEVRYSSRALLSSGSEENTLVFTGPISTVKATSDSASPAMKIRICQFHRLWLNDIRPSSASLMSLLTVTRFLCVEEPDEAVIVSLRPHPC